MPSVSAYIGMESVVFGPFRTTGIEFPFGKDSLSELITSRPLNGIVSFELIAIGSLTLRAVTVKDLLEARETICEILSTASWVCVRYLFEACVVRVGEIAAKRLYLAFWSVAVSPREESRAEMSLERPWNLVGFRVGDGGGAASVPKLSCSFEVSANALLRSTVFMKGEVERSDNILLSFAAFLAEETRITALTTLGLASLG